MKESGDHFSASPSGGTRPEGGRERERERERERGVNGI